MPPSSHQSHLLIVEDEKGRREIILDSPLYALGRAPICDIRLYSRFVSRRHGTLVQLPNDDGSFYYRIVDGNLKGKMSANGLMVNGRKLPACDLSSGDEIVFAPQVRAIYYCIRQDNKAMNLSGEFDATLVGPEEEDSLECESLESHMFTGMGQD